MVMKEFTAGERLFAADLNDNFDETQLAENILSGTLDAARIPNLDAAKIASGTFDAARIPAGVGGLVAVKSAIFTGVQSAAVTTGNNVAVTDLTITHEVADAANKLIISAFIGVGASNSQRGNLGLAVHDGTGLIAIGDADGSRTRVTAGGFVSSTNSNAVVTMPSVTFVHTPGAGSKTYTVRAVNLQTFSATLFINRSEVNTNSALSSLGVSSLVIQEVKV